MMFTNLLLQKCTIYGLKFQLVILSSIISTTLPLHTQCICSRTDFPSSPPRYGAYTLTRRMMTRLLVWTAFIQNLYE